MKASSHLFLFAQGEGFEAPGHGRRVSHRMAGFEGALEPHARPVNRRQLPGREHLDRQGAIHTWTHRAAVMRSLTQGYGGVGRGYGLRHRSLASKPYNTE